MPRPQVTVIVPTLALAERRALLERALDSIFGQDGIACSVVMVVNGPQFDAGLVAHLDRKPRITVLRLDAADLPGAFRMGRRSVTARWFTALDDDDYFLPGALALRVDALERSSAKDAVVTNGYCRTHAGDELVVSDMAAVGRDPLRALERSNWLLPGAWLCRTDPDSDGLFDGMPRQLECTYLAVRLATTRRLTFLDQPTVVWDTTTPASASKRASHTLGQPTALRRILELELPPDVRQVFEVRLGNAHHASSELLLNRGRRAAAWEQHLRSLMQPAGWRYLPFTRHLVLRRVSGRRQQA